MEKEIWKPIPGFNHYEASNKGRVRSLDRVVRFKNGGIHKYKGRVLKYRKNSCGYLDTGLTENGKTKTFKMHRLVALAFIPNPENKPQINHKNGIKDDNRIENLEWCTAQENVIHAIKTGLRKHHNRWPKEIIEHSRNNAKMVVKIVNGEIVATYDSVHVACEVFGVTQSAISKYISRGSSSKGFGLRYQDKNHSGLAVEKGAER